MNKFRIPKSYVAPLLITGILLAAHISFGILDTYTKLVSAITAAIATELLLHRFVTGKWRNLSSAYISGISAGILVRSPMIWPFALCAAISIASKYLFRFRDSHIWNPTNFGVVVMLMIASDSMAVLSIQWGNNMWAMLVIWLVGLFTIWQVKKFHICATYVIFFLLFAWVRSLYTGQLFLSEIAPLTGPMYQLFVLFMITDPKTTVSTKKGQMLVAFLIAFLEMFFRLGEAVYAPFYALFIVGPIAFIIDKIINERKEKLSAEAEKGKEFKPQTVQ
ncbi:MAG: RnfABCDGE type electron transport complex subunit D [Balneolaceae bacterium]|nr:RnfABCDGE type electron transport complex subunit D [Balneolaceae bacterium]